MRLNTNSFSKIKILFIICFCVYSNLNAQIGINTANPSPLSALDITSAKPNLDPRGVLVPRMNSQQRNSIDFSKGDADGLLIYNIDEGCFNYYDAISSAWQSLCGGENKAVGVVACQNINKYGVYYAGVPLSPANYIEIVVTVTVPGRYTILGVPRASNGYYFATTGQVLTTGTFTVIVPAIGTPRVAGTDVVDIKINGKQINPDCPSVNIPVDNQIILYNLDCNNVRVNGTYIQDKELDGTNTILMDLTNIDPASIGSSYDVIGTSASDPGFYFKGQGILSTSGTQQIVLYGRGTPTITAAGVVIDINCNSTLATGTNSCNTSTIDILGPPGYMLDCTSLPDTTLYSAGLNNIMPITIIGQVADVGELYSIETDIVNGISYSASGVIIAGPQTVNLVAKGTPINLGNFTFNITSNSIAATGTSCTAEVVVANKGLKVLSLSTNQDYNLNIANSDGVSAFLNSTNNFGINATTSTNPNFYFQNGWVYTTSTSIGTSLDNDLQIIKPDIVLICWDWNNSPGVASGTAIRNYLARGGIVLCCLEQGSQDFLRGLFNISNINVANSSSKRSPVFSFNADLTGDPIVNGPYGNLVGQNWGDENGPTQLVTNPPATTLQYAGSQDISNNNANGGRTSSFRTTDMDFVYFGDSGFTGSGPDGSGGYQAGDNQNFPSWFDANNYPTVKPNFGGGTRLDVSNSIFFANFMVWAADRARERNFPISNGF